MAPSLRAIISSILLAASMLAMASSSVELAEAPSGSGHRFELIRLPLDLRYSDHEYLMKLPMGDDACLFGVADTGSDLIWTNNSQLINSVASCCPGDEKHGGCCFGLHTFARTYGESAGVCSGFMGESTLKSQGSSYTLNIGCAVKFGCHAKQDNGCKAYRGGGIVGLGRGEESLVTQLRLHSFSYCLAEHNSFILLNDDSSLTLLKQQGKLITTKFAPSGNGYPKAHSRYYVKPNKIVLGGDVTNIPKACSDSEQGYKNGDGVMFIDSGASFTVLPKKVLDSVTEHVTKLMKKDPKDRSKNNRFTCYDDVKLPKDMPEMVLHFCDGAQLVIPVDNYMLLDDGEYCLVFLKAPDTIPDGMSILGSFQQRDMTMLFDIKGNTLSFMENKGCQAGEKKHAAV